MREDFFYRNFFRAVRFFLGSDPDEHVLLPRTTHKLKALATRRILKVAGLWFVRGTRSFNALAATT